MSTYTVAQALANTGLTGIQVADTAANIAANATNAALVSRVTLFSMSASGTVTAMQAAALATLGSHFSTATYTLTVKDTVAQLTASGNAAGLAISGELVAVADTAANILAAASNPIIQHAGSVTLTANATVSLSQLLVLEGLPSFTAPHMTITLADSAANLLALTAAEARPSLSVFQVSTNSTVTAAQALTLQAMSHFAIQSGVTLTIADTVAHLVADKTALATVLGMSGTAVNFADNVGDLLAQAGTFWSQYPHATVTLSVSGTATVGQVAALMGLPGFSVASGVHLTIADTVTNLLTLSGAQTALASAISLSTNGSASVAQLATLVNLPHFSPVYTLTADDTLANLATLTAPEHAVVSAETVDDTVANLLAAATAGSAILAAATTVIAELDGTVLNASQATQLAALTAHASLTLHATGTATTLTVTDSAQNLNAANASITTLQADGPVTVVASSSADRSILTAAAAAALVGSGVSPSTATLAVADTGGALSAVAAQIFGQGFEAITVTSGQFAGTQAELLDPTLHFAAGSSAQLSTNGIATAAQALALAALPGFSFGSNVTLTVQDSIFNILANATALASIATVVQALDTETTTAAQAATLAALPGFSLHGNFLDIADTAANLATATVGALALASGVSLTGDARISEATALIFAAMGNKFSANGNYITVADTAANLEALAGNANALAMVNLWASEAVLSADATATIANVNALLTLVGFNVGPHHLTIGDSAGNILAAGDTALALAYAVQLNQPSTVNAADAATLTALRNFSPAGMLTIADTPAHLAAMAMSLAAEASSVTLATETVANQSGYSINAAQFAAMLGLPNFSLAGFTGVVAVTDNATALTALAPDLTALTSGALSHLTMTLGAAATVDVATAEALHALPGFIAGGFLTISDTATALTTLDPATAALASTIELSEPASMTVATAGQLAALHNFTPDADGITIADTPANLAALSAGVAAIAASETIIPQTGANYADYTLDVAQFLALTRVGHLSFTGFNGPLIVQGTAIELATLAGDFIGVALGSPIAQSRGVLTTELTQGGTVSAETMAYLIGLPGFNLNGHTLILQDTPTALISAFSNFVVDASEVELAANNAPWQVTALQASELRAIGPLNAGPAGMIVADTATNLLASAYASGIAAATATVLDADATVSVAEAEALHALPDFSRGAYNLTISDTAANLDTLDAATAALATSIETIGGASSALSVSAFNTLVTSSDFNHTPDSLTVSDGATNLLSLVGSGNLSYVATTILNAPATLAVVDAEQLSTLPGILLGTNLTIADTAANLLHITGNHVLPDDWAVEQLASAILLTADAQVSAAQAALLAQIGGRFSNGGFHLTVQDTPTALLGLLNVLTPIVSQVYAVALAGGPVSISLGQARGLEKLPDFSFGSTTLTIVDTAANLTATVNAGLLSGIIANVPGVAITLAGNDTATVAQADTLYALGGVFSRGTSTLAIVDTAAHLGTLTPAVAAIANAVDLEDSAMVSVANFQAIRTLSNFSDNGNLLIVADSATNLLNLANTSVSLAAAIMLNAAATGLTAAQAETLATLPNFTTGIQHMTVVDSAADLTQITGNGTLPDDWAGELDASSVTLNGDATISAASAAQLAVLGGRFSLGSHAITISDTAANLLLSANAAGLALAHSVTLSGDEDSLSAAAAAQLAALSHFSKGSASITVSDVAAALALTANAAGLALADHVQLSQAGSLGVVAAETLIGSANFQVNAGATLTIADTLPDLLQLAGASLAHNGSVLTATPIELTADATVDAQQMQALLALPQAGLFSLNGYQITVEDSGRNLVALINAGNSVACSYVMVGDATLDATDADTLATNGVQIGSNTLTVMGTPDALLNLPASLSALNPHLTLSQASSASIADANQLATLAAEHLFNTGGYALTIDGSAAGLLGLGAATQGLATTLALTDATETLQVAQLLQLAALSSKFTLNGNTLAVTGDATDLASLNSLETVLVHSSVLDQSVTVDTDAATALAALPGFALGNGVTLTVQGSYAALEALPSLILSIATLEVTGPQANLTAAEASALTASPGFSALPGVIVEDTIAHLTNASTSSWTEVATGGYVVADTVGNLIADIGSTLLTAANSVTLTGDTQTDAGSVGTLATITNFSRESYALAVADSAPDIANNAAAIAALASSALVNSATPITAAQATQLATLNNDHLLSFAGGISLAVEDSYADLSGNNAAWAPLVATVTVQDTAEQLYAASQHTWVGFTPYYTLSGSEDIAAQVAVEVQSIGNRYQPGSYTLTVTDTAAQVVADAAAIQALGLRAQVTDSIAGVHAAAASLVGMGGTLQSVSVTDGTGVAAATAVELVALVAKLVTPNLTIQDGAAGINTNLAGLETLGTHISGVTVSDSAADVAQYATAIGNLAAFGTPVTIALTDVGPITVSAPDAAALVPLRALLAGVTINVSDDGATIGGNASALHNLGSILGTVTLADSDTTDAATAAALSTIDSHLGNGIKISVLDTAQAISEAATGIGTLNDDGRLGTVTASADSVAHVVQYGGALAALGASASISGAAATVSGALDSLESLIQAGLTLSITLTDGATPDIALSLQQLADDQAVLTAIQPPFHYAITDSSADIADNLGNSNSTILALGSLLDSIALNDGSVLTMGVATFTKAGVADSDFSALARLANGATVAVQNVTIDDFTQIDGLYVPASYAVADSGSTIAADLGSGMSALLAHRTSISSITPDGTITLEYAVESQQYVNGGAGSVFSKMPGANLVVNDVPAADLATLFTVGVAPSSVTVTDTDADIAANLATASPTLVQYATSITAISVTASVGYISLDATHALATGVDDGADSVFGTKMTGGVLWVTDAAISQLAALDGLYHAPAQIAVSDTAANVEHDLTLASPSLLETYVATIASITPDGTVELPFASLDAGVDQVLALLPADSLDVTGVPVANVNTLAAMAAFASMTVTGSAATIATNLAAGSPLALHYAHISSLTISDGPFVTLTDAEALAADTHALALLGAGSVKVTGVAVGDIANVVSHVSELASMTVSDSASAVGGDLAAGAGSAIETNIGVISNVTLTDTNPVLASVAAAVGPIAGKLIGTSLSVADTSAADVTGNASGLEQLGAALSSVTITDSATDIAAVAGDLAGLVNAGVTLHLVLTDGTPALLGAQAAAALEPVAGALANGAVNVSDTGGDVATYATALGELGAALGTVTLTDVSTTSVATASSIGPVVTKLAAPLQIDDSVGNIVPDLTGSSSVLNVGAAAGTITAISATGGGITLTDDQAEQVLHALGVLTDAGGVEVTGVSVAHLPTIGALAVVNDITISDTVGHISDDLVLLAGSQLGAYSGKITGITISGGGTVNIPYSEASTVSQAILGLLPAHTLAITDVPVNQVAAMVSFSGLYQMTVTDLASNVQADMVSGGAHVLETNHLIITAINATGTVTLDDSDAIAALDALRELSGSDVLVVNDVTLTDLPTIAALPALAHMTVSDDASTIQSDLTSGSSVLEHDATSIHSIGFSTGSAVTVDGISAGLVMDALAELPSGSLTVTGAAVSQVAALAALSALQSMTVSDTAALVQGDMASAGGHVLEGNYHSITSITVSGGPVTLEYGAAHAAINALDLLTGSGTLVVDDVPVADVTEIAGLGVRLGSMTVSDTGGDVQADIESGGAHVLEANYATISSIALSSGSVALGYGDASAAMGALSRLPGNSLTVSAVPVTDIATIAALTALTTMAVGDTGGAIAADLAKVADGGGTSYIATGLTGISSIVASSTVALTDTEAMAVVAALDKLQGSLTVSDVPLADAPTIAGIAALSSMTIKDSGDNIAGDLAQIAQHLSSTIQTDDSAITGFTVTGELVTLTDQQADAAYSYLAKLPAASLIVTGVPVSDVANIAGLGGILSTMHVQDTASAVQQNLASDGSLATDASAIAGIGLNLDSGQVTLTDAEANTVLASGILNKLPAGSLLVTGVPVTDIANIATISSLASMAVRDSTAAIIGDIGGSGIINGNAGKISGVAVNDGPINTASAETIYNGLPQGLFDESNLTISDTAGALVAANTAAAAMLSAAHAVTLSVDASNVSAADATTLYAVLRHKLSGMTLGVVDSESNVVAGANAAGVAFATSVTLNAPATIGTADATQLAGMSNLNLAGPAITVLDTLGDLQAGGYSTWIGIASSVMLSAASTSLSVAAITQLAGVPHFTTSLGHAIVAQDNIADILAMAQSPSVFALAGSFAITDTVGNVMSNLGALASAITVHSLPLTIDATGAQTNSVAVTLNAADYTTDAAVLDAITNATGIVKVVDGAAALAAIAGTLAVDPMVGEVDVNDYATNILANLTALESMGTKFKAATLSDASVNAAEVASLLTIPNLQATGLVISDSGSQIAAAVEAIQANTSIATSGMAFFNSHSVTLSANSVITASDAVALETLTTLQTSPYQLAVWDTASHLTDINDGYLAAVNNTSKISAVYLKTTGGTATITAATAAALLSITNFNKDNPPSVGGSNVLTLVDTAAHIDSYYGSLIGHTNELSGIQINATASVNDNVFGQLLQLGATMASGQTLTVRDSAANIIAGAPTQTAGSPSIIPLAWQLSGSATVSEAGAAVLGGIATLSTGAYALTLSATDATTSVSDANAIGNLGSAFHLGGFQLIVPGSVSTVAGLSANARTIVTPQISDSFAALAAGLTVGDGLLSGTITVTDSSAVSTTQANEFLALLGGSGIPVANVSFGGNIETITDSLTDITAFTAGANWTTNSTVHTDFRLVVSDSLATLINPTNLTALEGMNGTTFSGNQTGITAAQAESLFLIENAIHFNANGYTISLQDSVAQLLLPANSDGVTMAAVLQLSGNDTTNAAGAETLLPDSRFHLNYQLTISDTSDNLLDGFLSGVITAANTQDANHGYSGTIVVTLSDNEADLDANTAEALVSLPGFSDTGGWFSIADSSSYLLNPHNQTAEADATSVTLAGDETVSAATAAALAALPHFAPGDSTLTLASNDYAGATTLDALAGLGSNFQLGGHTLTMTQSATVNAAQLAAIGDFGSGLMTGGHTLTLNASALDLTPAEYNALQSDNVSLSGNVWSAAPSGVGVTESSGSATFNGTGVNGATVHLYDASGNPLTSTPVAASAFTVMTADAGVNFALTETVGGTESAPIIILDQTILTSDATSDSATFATSGQVQVGTNAFVNLYTAGSQPTSPANPVLVYDPTAHTVSFDAAGHAPIVLLTLGTSTHPGSLDPSEILIKHV